MGLKINFSKNEAESSAREIIPSGAYVCNVVDVETRDVKPGSPNVGKPYWNLRFVVSEGKYAGNSIFGNIMLFSTDKEGTLSSLAQFLKALGYEVTEGEFDLPEDDEIQGKSLVVVGRKLAAGPDPKTKRDLPERFKISGYKRIDGAAAAKATNSSLLP